MELMKKQMFKCARFNLLLNYCIYSLVLINISLFTTVIGNKKQIGMFFSNVFEMITLFKKRNAALSVIQIKWLIFRA